MRLPPSCSTRGRSPALAVVFGVACGTAGAQPASFTGLGPMTAANGLSADGSTAIGHADSAPARWHEQTGWTVLPSPPGSLGTWSPSSVSADGSVIIGNTEQLLLRWTQATGTVSMGTPGGYSDVVSADGISADGAVVVGTAWKEFAPCIPGWFARFESRGWRWEAGHFQKLDPLGQRNSSYAHAVSGDGTVVFGWSADYVCEGGLGPVSCLWDGSTHATPFYAGVLLPRSASADGGVAVGYNTAGSAFRWTEPGGVVSLGPLAGMTVSDALSVSADGRVIVGFSGVPNTGPWAAVAWDELHGVRGVRDVLMSLGLNLVGWTMTKATGVSADGRTIVGNGVNPLGQDEAWIAFLGDAVCYPDCNTDGALTVADFGCFQTRFVAGDPYADCNGDAQLTVADFGCFQTRFVASCP